MVDDQTGKKRLFSRLFSRKTQVEEISHDPFPKKNQETGQNIDQEIINIKKILDEKEKVYQEPVELSDLKREIEVDELKQTNDKFFKDEKPGPYFDVADAKHIADELESQLSKTAEPAQDTPEFLPLKQKIMKKKKMRPVKSAKSATRKTRFDITYPKKHDERVALREKQQIEQQKKQILKAEDRLKKKEKKIAVMKKELKDNFQKSKHMLDREETSVTKKIRKLETLQKSIEEKQASIQPILDNIKAKEADIDKRLKILLAREEDIKKREIECLENDRLLSAKEDELILEVKHLDADKAMIAKKETEIQEIYKKIEKKHSMLVKKDQNLQLRTQKIKMQESLLKSKQQELGNKKKKFTQDQKKLEQKNKQIDKLMKTIKANKIRKESIVKIEQTCNKVKQKLKSEMAKLEKVYSKRILIEQGNNMHQEEVHNLLPDYEPKSDNDVGNIHEFIEKTSRLIHDGKYVESNRNIANLISKHQMISKSNPYKKEIYYEILRLKHELKLALLK